MSNNHSEPAATAVRRIALVSCGKQKLTKNAPARELYTSSLFKLSAGYAAQCFDAWYILSGFHGLVEPDQRLHPYDRSLREKGLDERRAWASIVQGKLIALEPGIRAAPGFSPGSRGATTKITLLAGGEYVEALMFWLAAETPLAGMGIGQRLKWLKTQTASGS